MLIRGTKAGDGLYGGAGADRIYGLAGADYIVAGYGNDVVAGAAGDDYITNLENYISTIYGEYDKFFGGDGNDTLISWSNVGELHGDRGNDYLSGNAGLFDGGDGNDSIHFDNFGGKYTEVTVNAGIGNDLIQGNAGRVHGGAGDDVLYAGGSVHGDAGNDYFSPPSTFASPGPTYLTGGRGADMFDIAKHVWNSAGDVTITDFNARDGDRLDLFAWQPEEEVGKSFAQQRLDQFYTYDRHVDPWGNQSFDGVIRIGDEHTGTAPDGSLMLHTLGFVHSDLIIKGVDHIDLKDWIVW